nr:hypothetical protein [Tanacetum cinerariifolium]
CGSRRTVHVDDDDVGDDGDDRPFENIYTYERIGVSWYLYVLINLTRKIRNYEQVEIKTYKLDMHGDVQASLFSSKECKTETGSTHNCVVNVAVVAAVTA